MAARPARVPFVVVVLAGCVTIALTMLLPATAPWSAVKLATATYAVAVLPGAVILRAVGWPRSPATALAASLAWSVAALAPGLVLVFVLDRGVVVALVWLAVVVAGGLVAGRGKPVEVDVRISRLLLLLLVVVAAFTLLVLLARHDGAEDAMEHIARIRKLSELDPPRRLADIGLLPPDTGLHPGYAFPLWHAAVALVVLLTGLDPAAAFPSLAPLLVPVMAAAVYGAGRQVFASRAAGVATVVAYLAVFAFPESGVGRFDRLMYPGFVAIFVLWPLMIDRAFAFLRHGGRATLLTLAAAAFVMALIHGSYNPLVLLLLGAFAAVRVAVTRDAGETRRLVTVLAAASVPFLVLLPWLLPIATSAATEGGPQHFASMLDRYGNGMLRLKPEYVTRGGAAHLLALLLVPVVGVAARTRAAAFVVGAIAVPVLILIVPLLYTPFADVLSVSQSRRLLYLLPWAFSLVAAALVLGRFRWIAAAAGLALATALQAVYPGSFTYQLTDPGPAWVAWVAVVGGLLALAAGARRHVRPRLGESWVVPIVVAVAIPVAVGGLPDAPLGRDDVTSFHPALLSAIRDNVRRDDVLMAPLRIAYRVAGHAPVYIVAASLGHGGDTVHNEHQRRRIDVATFFSDEVTTAEAAATVRRWDADWILVHEAVPYPAEVVDRLDAVYEGTTYSLYRVNTAELPP